MNQEARADSKVILIGEHAVVGGYPALVAGLPAGMTAVDEGPAERLTVSISPWELEATADSEGDIAPRALEALDRALADKGLTSCDRARRIAVWAAVPPRAGLGSSASLAICVIRLLALRAGRSNILDLETLTALASSSEAVFHGKPSGIDAAAVAQGGVGLFQRGQGLGRVHIRSPLEIVVALSGERPPAVEMIRKVVELCSVDTHVRRMRARLGDLALAGANALDSGDPSALGEAMCEAHRILSRLGVSTVELDTMVTAALDAGALGAKLTGAGGGGCMLALCTEQDAGRVLGTLEKRASWARHFTIPTQERTR